MKPKKKFRNKISLNARINIIILILFTVLASFSIIIQRAKLLENAQSTGMALARSYSVEEQQNITVYETLIELGTQYIDSQTVSGAEYSDIQEWITTFFDNVTNIIGTDAIDPYAVVNGKIIAANPWDGDNGFDLENSEWYKQAIAANGETIFTPAYTDAITGTPVVTVAKKSAVSDNILAFDVFPYKFRLHPAELNLPERSSYYLCDENGTLLYSQTTFNTDPEALQYHVRELVKKINEGSLYSYNTYIWDSNMERRGVYYSHLDNGWLSVITIPYNTILEELTGFTIGFSAIFVFFLITTLFMIWRSSKLNRYAERTNETVRVLGNSYYAIYRIDYNLCTYEMIKGSDYVRSKIAKTGPYEDLLSIIQDIIEPNTYNEFLDSFSPESIRRLVNYRIRDFGGDFQRLFDGVYKWVNIRVLFDESLAPNEVVLCFREVDEEKQRQLQQKRLLENALEAAKRSERSKNTFFSNMSHDMRTPLNAIIGLCELASKNTSDPEKTADYLKKINTSSKQLLGLINDILEMSRLEQGKISINYEQCDLKKCIEDCTDVFVHQAEKERKSFCVSFDIRDRIVLGDFFRIGQIINNLLSNAFKFTPEGGKISLSVKQFNSAEHSKYQITVSDSGIGMSEDFLNHIFEPYARETRFAAKHIAGTGLGMPIVKSLVSQMSGQISVESELGKGSTFTVTLPLETIHENSATAEESENTVKTEFNLDGKKILLAEDNEINMEIATEILSMNGINVIQAWNGLEAVNKFSQSKPFEYDAILMDMQMPEMDGCEAARAIRAMTRQDAKTVPIIAVTANAFAEDISATTNAGMNAHISKPIDFSILCKTLSELMNG